MSGLNKNYPLSLAESAAILSSEQNKKHFPAASAKVPSISAIVTCHNYGKYLEQCLRSLCSQTLAFSEILVIDDASTDQTSFLASKYRGNIHYHRILARNAAIARQYGYRISNGDYIVMIDADDWLDPNYAARMVPPLEADSAAGLSYCGATLAFEGDCSWFPADIHHMEEFGTETLRKRNFIPNCAMVRREAWLGQDPALRALEDWDHWLRIVSSGWKAVLVPERLFYYRIHAGSRTHTDIKEGCGDSVVKVRNKVLDHTHSAAGR